MKTARLLQAAVVASLFAGGAASAAVNLIDNGDFEDYSIFVPDGGYTKISAGAGDLAFWTIGGTSIDLILNSYGSIGANSTSVDMLGTPGPGEISQWFFVDPYTTYNLSFDLSRNPNGGYTALEVDVNGTQTVFVGTNTPTTKTLSFTTGNVIGIELLTFRSVQGDDYSGAVLDNVVLTAAVPEPETYAMMLAGLGLVGYAARRRKQA